MSATTMTTSRLFLLALLAALFPFVAGAIGVLVSLPLMVLEGGIVEPPELVSSLATIRLVLGFVGGLSGAVWLTRLVWSGRTGAAGDHGERSASERLIETEA